MIYVCSDIHGVYNRYEKLLNEIQFSDSDTLYVLGDMIDRSEDGIRILMDMRTHPNIVPFIGNHELFLLFSLQEKAKDEDDWEDSFYTRNWFSPGNGGRITYERFSAYSESGQQEILDYLHGAYIQKMVTVNGQQYCLCHSSYMGAPDSDDIRREYNGDPMLIPAKITLEDVRFNADTMLPDSSEGSDVFHAVWYSPLRDRYDFDLPWEVFSCYSDTIFIAGHVPVQHIGETGIYRKDNYIDIDGGCALINRNRFGPDKCSLLCLRLNDMKTFSVR